MFVGYSDTALSVGKRPAIPTLSDEVHRETSVPLSPFTEIVPHAEREIEALIDDGIVALKLDADRLGLALKERE